jgi:Uma2 family endonuclease
MAIEPDVYMTSQEYLTLEKQAEYKSEYIAGTMVAMSGASRKHNLIVTNIVTSLGQPLRGRPCEVYANDMRVKMPASDLYVYPDVVVVCGSPQFEDSDLDTLLNPTLVIEVLSQSTEFRDRGVKAQGYRLRDSLAEYLLIAQDRCRIEQYVRQTDNQWLLADFRAPDETVNLVSLRCALSVQDIYDRVLPT